MMDQKRRRKSSIALKRFLERQSTNDEFDSPVTRPEQPVATYVRFRTLLLDCGRRTWELRCWTARSVLSRDSDNRMTDRRNAPSN
jgi:hypothetical protein